MRRRVVLEVVDGRFTLRTGDIIEVVSQEEAAEIEPSPLYDWEAEGIFKTEEVSSGNDDGTPER